MREKILEMADKILPGTLFDRLLIEWRRFASGITDYYPNAVFISKKISNKKYCIVRYGLPTFELMAAGIQYLFIYYKLKERGYIPIIDLEPKYSFMQGNVGENNSWDKCFKQPITANEAAKQSYVLATGERLPYSFDAKTCFLINNDDTDHFLHIKKENFREYYAKAKKYTEPIWQVREELIAELDEEIWKTVQEHRVLGVNLREKFSKERVCAGEGEETILRNHPMLPGIKEIIDIIKTQLTEWNYDFVFVATIYEETLEVFKEEFGNKVIYINRERESISKPDVLSLAFDGKEKEVYEHYRTNFDYFENKAKAYVKEIVALSRCNYFIGGACSGSIAALVMNGGEYEDIHILEDINKIQRY